MTTTTIGSDVAAGATTWQIDAAHSSVDFSVRHMMVSTVRGRFGTVAGVAKGIGNGARAEVEVTIDAASIDTGMPKRDEHLRSADFFDVAEYPELTFRSTRIEGNVGESFRLIGDLTIRDITREVVLEAENQGQTFDPWGNDRIGFSAKARIRRSDFGLTWNQVLETGGVAVSDEIRISVDVAFIRPGS